MTSAKIKPAETKKTLNWMNSSPITVSPTTSVSTAFQLMSARHIRRLPVMEGGRLVGILTLGDVRSKAADTDSDEARRIPVAAAMTGDPVSITPGTSLLEAARIMIDRKISGLPVVSEPDKRLVGIITESDIFRAFVADETA